MTRSVHLRRALALSGLSIAWSGIVGTIAVSLALASHGLSLLGFGADAIIDAVASVTLVWRFTVESRDAERGLRVERTAERTVGVALVLLAVYLVVASVRSLVTQDHPAPVFAGVAILLASIVVLPPLAVAKFRVASHLNSGALRADSFLTGAAALLAAISLASIVATDAFGFWWADAAAALLVGLLVAREGWASFSLSRSGSR
jgi:divalent metal cation (Fe/Co/Zn/Cd) transporter